MCYTTSYISYRQCVHIYTQYIDNTIHMVVLTMMILQKNTVDVVYISFSCTNDMPESHGCRRCNLWQVPPWHYGLLKRMPTAGYYF